MCVLIGHNYEYRQDTTVHRNSNFWELCVLWFNGVNCVFLWIGVFFVKCCSVYCCVLMCPQNCVLMWTDVSFVARCSVYCCALVCPQNCVLMCTDVSFVACCSVYCCVLLPCVLSVYCKVCVLLVYCKFLCILVCLKHTTMVVYCTEQYTKSRFSPDVKGFTTRSEPQK